VSVRIEDLATEQVELLPERDTMQTVFIGNVSIAVAINVAAGNIVGGNLTQNALAAAANISVGR